jgi:GTP1/Obg family GTP-binding protein
LQQNANKHLDSKTYAMILKFYHDLTNLQFDIQNVKKKMIRVAWENNLICKTNKLQINTMT